MTLQILVKIINRVRKLMDLAALMNSTQRHHRKIPCCMDRVIAKFEAILGQTVYVRSVFKFQDPTYCHSGYNVVIIS